MPDDNNRHTYNDAYDDRNYNTLRRTRQSGYGNNYPDIPKGYTWLAVILTSILGLIGFLISWVLLYTFDTDESYRKLINQHFIVKAIVTAICYAIIFMLLFIIILAAA